MDLTNALENTDFSQGIGQKCYKCEGIIKSRYNLTKSLTYGKWGHKRCSRFNWNYLKDHPETRELHAKQMRRELGLA